MKEYIAKEDMTITLNHNGGLFRLEIPFSRMDELKTVTEADICRELTEKYFDAIANVLHDKDLGLTLNQCLAIYARIMNECNRIAEMEKGE